MGENKKGKGYARNDGGKKLEVLRSKQEHRREHMRDQEFRLFLLECEQMELTQYGAQKTMMGIDHGVGVDSAAVQGKGFKVPPAPQQEDKDPQSGSSLRWGGTCGGSVLKNLQYNPQDNPRGKKPTAYRVIQPHGLKSKLLNSVGQGPEGGR